MVARIFDQQLLVPYFPSQRWHDISFYYGVTLVVEDFPDILEMRPPQI